MSAAEIRAIARAISGGGIAADARAVGQTGSAHAMSIAELARDIVVIAPRWTGKAAERSYEQAERFTRASSALGLEFGHTLKRLTGLSGTAYTTNQRFSELNDPSTTWLPGGEKIGAKVAAEFRSTYTEPVQTDAGTMPLGAVVYKSSYDFKLPQLRDGKTPVKTPEEPGPLSGGGGDESDGGTSNGGGGATTEDTTTSTTADPTDTTGTTTDETTGTGTGTGQGTGTGTGTGTGSTNESGTGTDPSAGLGDDTTTDDPTTDDPTAATDQPASLLSPAATVPVGAGSRTPGGGLTGVRGGGQVASPLGLRQDSAIARSTTTTPTGTTTSTGARPTGPYGMPAAGAGGQRGQGDGRHRLPAYLIDRRNGEELVGDLPLVGPGVIGQWKTDGPPDTPRTTPPPTRTDQRPR